MVNKDGAINIKANYSGVTYEVVCTEVGESRSVWSAVDTIKNSNGKALTKTRLEWFYLFSKF